MASPPSPATQDPCLLLFLAVVPCPLPHPCPCPVLISSTTFSAIMAFQFLARRRFHHLASASLPPSSHRRSIKPRSPSPCLHEHAAEPSPFPKLNSAGVDLSIAVNLPHHCLEIPSPCSMIQSSAGVALSTATLCAVRICPPPSLLHSPRLMQSTSVAASARD
ncbi:hypothetical protein M0R45_026179 [Rubus argutus]|uniref:Uncharacterized protein n=1 Tax=Rubus argutus TaxID=59490 RepID=A0AAW1WZ33_RUBAR